MSEREQMLAEIAICSAKHKKAHGDPVFLVGFVM